MSYTIGVKYFNAFWLKRIVNNSSADAWPGLPWNPTGYPVFPFASTPKTGQTRSNFM